MYTSLIPAKGFKARFKGEDGVRGGKPWDTPIVAWAASTAGGIDPLAFCEDGSYSLNDPRNLRSFDYITEDQ